MAVTYLLEEEQDVKDVADPTRKKTNNFRKFLLLPAD